jgi:hypothetical protein
MLVESKGFRRRCVTLRIPGFVDFVHGSEFQATRKHMFQKLYLFPSSGEGREIGSLGPVVQVSSF